MPALVRRLVCWLISAEDLFTLMSPVNEAGFMGILDCRLALEFSAAMICLFICLAHFQHPVARAHYL
jgi:hypothetical protein